MKKKIKIVDKVLKRYLGYAYLDSNKIEIDPRQKSKRYLDTLIHECLHILFPEESETSISEKATTITSCIWKKNYRRIEK